MPGETAQKPDRPPKLSPKYRQRPGRTQALMTLTDSVASKRRDYWLGEYGTPESREAHHPVIAEWDARGRVLPPPRDPQPTAAKTAGRAIAEWRTSFCASPTSTNSAPGWPKRLSSGNRSSRRAGEGARPSALSSGSSALAVQTNGRDLRWGCSSRPPTGWKCFRDGAPRDRHPVLSGHRPRGMRLGCSSTDLIHRLSVSRTDQCRSCSPPRRRWCRRAGGCSWGTAGRIWWGSSAPARMDRYRSY